MINYYYLSIIDCHSDILLYLKYISNNFIIYNNYPIIPLNFNIYFLKKLFLTFLKLS